MPDVKFSNLYPYTDFHELNLDWVIKEVKYWSTKVGKTIQSIELTGTVGLVDTYTINYSDGTTSTFDVTNGNGITSVAKTGTAGNVDTYTITLTDGSTSTFTVTNGAVTSVNGQTGDVTGLATEDQVNNVNRHFDYNNLITANLSTMRYGYYFHNGWPTQFGDYYSYFIIPVTAGTTYTSKTDMRYIGSSSTTLGEHLYSYTPNFTGDLYVTLYNTDMQDWNLTSTGTFGHSFGTVGKLYVDDGLSKKANLSHFDPANLCNLYQDSLVRGYYYSAWPYASAPYSYFVIPVTSGTTYKFKSKYRMLSKQSASITNVAGQDDYTADFTGDLYVTFYNSDFYSWGVGVNTIEIGDFAVPDHSAIAGHDLLAGKKWAVCGDSFTDGGGTGTTISGGKYNGQNYTYPWLIGNRTDINVIRFFTGGQTLAWPASPGTFTNSLTNPTGTYYYQTIPVDVDYITIYLGINDNHHATGGGDGEDPTGYIPLGDITDNTTASYYGAWNTVLSWLITNRPNAHIGIIVTNGIANDDTWRQAQIAIAEKYGIPYIDLNGDARTPAMLRTSNPNIDASVKTALITKWRVSIDNEHPNDAAQLFESTTIEAFLRTL